MDLLTFLAYLAMASTFMTSETLSTNFTILAPIMANAQSNNSSDLSSLNLPLTVKLLPYQVFDKKALSYADILLNITNTSTETVEIEITQLLVVTSGNNQVLMSSTPQDLALPPIVSLQPGENRVVEYRLKSESKVYKRGQQVMALIQYRQDAQPETTVESPAEQVAFIMR